MAMRRRAARMLDVPPEVEEQLAKKNKKGGKQISKERASELKDVTTPERVRPSPLLAPFGNIFNQRKERAETASDQANAGRI